MAVDDITPPREIRGINLSEAITAFDPDSQERQQGKKQEKHPKKQVRDYFRPLSKAVELSNKRLSDRKLPYRFSVYKKWGEVYIELFILDDNGMVKEKQRKNISYDDFNRIIDDVVAIEGLFLDYRA